MPVTNERAADEAAATRAMARRSAANRAMDAYARGERAAFEQLYGLIAPELWGFIVGRVHDRAAAEDLMQQTLLQMHRARGRYQRGASVHPWMFTIAWRLIIDRARRRRAQTDIAVMPLVDPGPSPEQRATASQMGARVLDAIAELPERQRAVLEFVRAAGLSHKETAAALGTTESAVKSLMHRALASLRCSGAIDEAAPW